MSARSCTAPMRSTPSRQTAHQGVTVIRMRFSGPVRPSALLHQRGDSVPEIPTQRSGTVRRCGMTMPARAHAYPEGLVGSGQDGSQDCARRGACLWRSAVHGLRTCLLGHLHGGVLYLVDRRRVAEQGLLRLSGTFLGVSQPITLIALFPQDRWLFLVGMSIFGGFCTLYDARTRLSQTRLASPRLRGELACAGPLCVNLSGEPSSSSDPSLPRFWVKRPRRSRSRHAC